MPLLYRQHIPALTIPLAMEFGETAQLQQQCYVTQLCIFVTYMRLIRRQTGSQKTTGHAPSPKSQPQLSSTHRNHFTLFTCPLQLSHHCAKNPGECIKNQNAMMQKEMYIHGTTARERFFGAFSSCCATLLSLGSAW